MRKRLEQLHAWNVPASVMGIATHRLPHLAFETICEPLRVEERRVSLGLQLDRVEVRPEVGGRLSAALWEHDAGDGHAFEVMYCAGGEQGLEYWHVMYADDTSGPEGSLVARSEQGLYFWLFFSLIQSEFNQHGERAYETLVAVANAVGFVHLVEVFRLEEEIGADFSRRDELTGKSLSIA